MIVAAGAMFDEDVELSPCLGGRKFAGDVVLFRHGQGTAGLLDLIGDLSGHLSGNGSVLL